MRFLCALFLALSTAIATPDTTPESSPRSITPRKVAESKDYSVWVSGQLNPGEYSIQFGRGSFKGKKGAIIIVSKNGKRNDASDIISDGTTVDEVSITDYLKVVFPQHTALTGKYFSSISFTVDS